MAFIQGGARVTSRKRTATVIAPVVFPSTPYFGARSGNPAVTITNITPTDVYISIQRPLAQWSWILGTEEHNTAATRVGNPSFSNAPGFIFGQEGDPAINRDLVVGDDATYDFTLYQLFSDNSTLSLVIHMAISADGAVVVAPPTTTTPVATPPVVGVTPGVTNSGSAYPTGPGGGTFGDVLVLIQGQSNSIFFVDAYDAPSGYKSVYRYMDMVRQFTGLGQTQIREVYQRSDQTAPANGPASLFTGSNTYHSNTGPVASDPKWLEPVGHTLANPSTWGNTYIMDLFLAYCASKQSMVGSNRPVILIRMHNENDAKLADSDAAVYAEANLEFIKRYRAVMGRPAALLPVFFCGAAYDSGTNNTANKNIRDAWRAQALDAANNCYIGHGSALDASDRGDSSHWDNPGADRVARRMALRTSRWLFDNGYSANDLSWVPRLGPTIGQVARVSGQANKVDFIVTHDGGSDIIAPTGGPNYGDFIVMDGTTQRNVTALDRQSATVIRATISSNLSSGGAITLDYGARTPFNGIASQWTDNWHLVSKPALAATIDNIPNVRMILNRFGGVATETAASVIATNPTPVNPATQTFSISGNPGTRDAGTWSPTITSANITSISYVVVSPTYAFIGAVVDAATTGSKVIAVSLTQTGQFVKYWPTGNINAYKDTLPVQINATAVPAAAGTDRQFAHDFTKDLTIGVNLERDNTGFATPAWCADLVACGCTHVRMYPFVNATLGFRSSGQMQNHYNAISTILAAGLKVLFDLQDVSSIGDLNDSGCQPYIIQCCADISGRGWNPAKIVFGHTQEMANAGNSTFNQISNVLCDLMRQRLPAASLLMQSGGGWGHPDNLTDGTLTLGSDNRRIYSWHAYEWDRSNQAAWASRKTQVKTWAAANNLETVSAEFNGFDPGFSDPLYSTYPAVIDAFAKGAGNCGGTIWTVTNGSGWRLNVDGGNGALRSEVRTALIAANSYIRAQTYFGV